MKTISGWGWPKWDIPDDYEIQLRAYRIWEARQRTGEPGDAESDYLRALKGETTSPKP